MSTTPTILMQATVMLGSHDTPESFSVTSDNPHDQVNITQDEDNVNQYRVRCDSVDHRAFWCEFTLVFDKSYTAEKWTRWTVRGTDRVAGRLSQDGHLYAAYLNKSRGILTMADDAHEQCELMLDLSAYQNGDWFRTAIAKLDD
jgi:hypothetical protein